LKRPAAEVQAVVVGGAFVNFPVQWHGRRRRGEEGPRAKDQ
jgi:ribosomal protein S7